MTMVFRPGRTRPIISKGRRSHDHDTGFSGNLNIQLFVGFTGPVGIVIRGPGDLSVYGNGNHQADMHDGIVSVFK
jgi:hypothetical protein